jgi:hypothetical protein
VWLTPAPVVPLNGSERFTGLDATVADFWRWAFSDLRNNTTRGILAEFLVARARIIRQQALKTVGIGWVRQHATGPLPYGQLADAIHAAATS